MIKRLIAFAKRHFKLIIAIIVVLVLLYTLSPLTRRGKEERVVPTVEKKQLLRLFTASGTIEPKNKAILHYPTPGKVIWVGVEKGNTVYAGQSIASLDTTELKASFRQTEQDFIAAKAEVEKVYDETGRKVEESFSEKVKRTAAEAKQNKAFDAMKKIEKQIQDATLVSPINGIMTNISIRRGENVGISGTIEIIDPSSFYFKAEVDETDYTKVFIDQEVRIMLDAFKDKTFNGKVSFVGEKTEITSSGVSFIPVEVELDPNQKIIAGLAGEAEFIEKEK